MDEVRMSDILADVAVSVGLATQRRLTVTIPSAPVPRHGILENNLTRKGIWSPDADRGGPVQEVFTLETTDVVGKLVMESALGRLSVFEMETVSWILAQWVAEEKPESPWVQFSLYQLARDFGVAWGGSRGAFIKESLRRLDRVRFTAEVWSAEKKELVTEHFGIFDRVRIVERKTRRDAAPEGGSVRVKIGDFLHQQLQLGQYHRYSWQVLRGALRTPLAKRLYVFLDGQKGYETPQGIRYEVTVTRELLATLGLRDTNLARVRARLRRACAELLEAERRFVVCEVREARTGWVLSTLRRRSPAPAALLTAGGS
jgi:hypothetical protein